MKIVQENQFLSLTRCLKTKLTRSFSVTEKWDFLLLYQVKAAYGAVQKIVKSELHIRPFTENRRE